MDAVYWMTTTTCRMTAANCGKNTLSSVFTQMRGKVTSASEERGCVAPDHGTADLYEKCRSWTCKISTLTVLSNDQRTSLCPSRAYTVVFFGFIGRREAWMSENQTVSEARLSTNDSWVDWTSVGYKNKGVNTSKKSDCSNCLGLILLLV